MNKVSWLLGVLLLLLAASQSEGSAATISGVAQISDGDTVVVGRSKIRLVGIDAPETDQVCVGSSGATYRCGIASRHALIEIIGSHLLTCQGQETDRYGRHLMVCHAGGININAEMVRQGWALAFRRYSTSYVTHEEVARSREAGMWSGAFVAPWDWRGRNLQTTILGARHVPIHAQSQLVPQPYAAESAQTGCRIKGNINKKKQRIYHVPGQRDYERTKISVEQGERWFCTEAEARAAGWRRARSAN